ncbi:MAG TPA: WD40 repeat domain-containing protein [Pirellulaceae bacterium]|nr:WD40 repeat domain-containing protein [Pirellulaceae bacterium]
MPLLYQFASWRFFIACASVVVGVNARAAPPALVDLANADARSLAFIDDTSLIAVLSDGTARGFNLETGAENFRFTAHVGGAHGVSISHDGERFATCGVDQTICIWDLKKHEKLQEMTGHEGPVIRVAFLPDHQLISAGHDATIRLWDTRTGRELHVFREHRGKIIDLDVSPHGDLAASASHDKSIRVWGIPQRQLLKTFNGHTHGAMCVRFSPNATLLATGAEDKKLLLWNVVEGTVSRKMQGHSGMLRAVTFSPDGKYVLSGAGGEYRDGKFLRGEDFDVRVWNAAGTPFGILVGHTGPIQAIRFSPSGKIIATASWDKTLRFWHLWDSSGKAPAANTVTLFDENQQQRERQKLLAATYREARALVDVQQGGSGAMTGVLAPWIELLQPIEVAGREQQLQWQTLNVLPGETRFEAVRFKSPLDVSADLYWAFTAPSPMEWYIVPAKGEMTGFRGWQRVDELKLPNLEIPAGHCVRFQTLSGGQILPGQEYVLWFSFPDSEPTTISMALRLLPASSEQVPQTADEIAKALGLRVPLRYDASRFRVQRFPPKSNTQPDPDGP